MSRQDRSVIDALAPWHGGTPWWVILVEGLVALVVGIYILTQPARVGQWLVFLIAGYLVITNALEIYASVSGPAPADGNAYRLLASGIGFIAGLLVLLVPLVTTAPLLALIAILGIGLLARGLVGLVGVLLGREAGGARWGSALANLLNLVFGGLLLYLTTTAAAGDVLRWLGIAAVVGGALLILYGVVLYRRPAPAI